MGAAIGIKAMVRGWRGNRRIYRVNSDEPSRHYRAIPSHEPVCWQLAGRCQAFSRLPPDRVRVGITSPSRVRDAKFTEKGSTFCTA
jgi:hypothetical protein